MSLILDALNRAEQERLKVSEATAVQPAETVVVQEAQSRRFKKPLWILIFTLVILGAAYVNRLPIAHWLGAEQQLNNQFPVSKVVSSVSYNADENTAEEIEPVVSDSNPVSTPINTVASESQMETSDSVVQSTDNRVEDPLIKAASQQVDDLYSATTTESAHSVEPVIATLYEPEIEKPAQAPKPTESYSLPAPEPEPVVPAAVAEDSIASLTDVIGFADIPWQTKMTIPSINYSQHNYRASGESTIVINGVVLRAGDQSEELLVEQIRRDGSVFVFRGTRFTLAALSGWINL